AELKGTNGSIGVEKDAAGRELPDGAEEFREPKPGNDLILTLDQNIQYFAERELDKAVSRYNPALAVIMVMEVKTGNILAMASRPTYDCNNWKKADSKVWNRNPAVWYNYEPGSTFKIITLAAALNEKTVKIEDNFFDPGYITVADRQIHCWKYGGHGSQTFAEAVMNSCNPVFAQVGLNLGVEKYYQYLQEFGMGQKTDSGLPGEASGIMIPQAKATELNLAVMAMGQSIAVTPIQLLRAVAAVANGGIMMQPRLVEKVVSPDGEVLQSFDPQEAGRVISPETSRQAAALLEKVVAEGTGRNAFVEGYRTAGKTGTAQVVGESGGYVSGKYVASFAGFAPADAPRFAALIMIAEPQGGIYYGGQVAAPIFQALARDILHYLEIPADSALVKPPDPELWYEEVKTEVEVPEVLYTSLNEAIKALADLGLGYKTEGRGEMVYQQIPAAGTKVYSGSKVLLQLEPKEQSSQITVPRLTGLTADEAESLLVKLNLGVELSGQGLVVEQKPEAGALADSGQIIQVKLANSKLEAAPIITPELIYD
ncbi:MAG: PASTA domain-containing protein, partial [Clostridia bacterium]|nr:PASTA domain-containing protein [Clostridia bacterium]